MEREANPNTNRARFEALEENQKEIMATLAELKTTMQQLSLDSAEQRERRERRRAEHNGEREESHRSSKSERSRHADEREGEGRRQRGIAVDR